MHQVPGRINQTRDLLLVQNGRKPSLTLGKWNVIGKVWPTQRLDKEKTQRRSAALDGSGRKLALAKQIRLYWRIWSGPSRSGERWKYFAKSSTAKMYERTVL
jgi:hypothetical protein